MTTKARTTQPQPEAERKRPALLLRLSPEVVALIRRRAGAAGLTLSAYVEGLVTRSRTRKFTARGVEGAEQLRVVLRELARRPAQEAPETPEKGA